ncbi:hypothetical protein TNCV_2673881 [Trichonephila clavipes]|nr:hypothetical protein TNCV_2673881 [Trichonephila clavipes]
MRFQKRKERLTATNGVAATSRKIIAATSFGVRKGTWFSEKQTCYNYFAFDEILVWQEHESIEGTWSAIKRAFIKRTSRVNLILTLRNTCGDDLTALTSWWMRIFINSLHPSQVYPPTDHDEMQA